MPKLVPALCVRAGKCFPLLVKCEQGRYVTTVIASWFSDVTSVTM